MKKLVIVLGLALMWGCHAETNPNTTQSADSVEAKADVKAADNADSKTAEVKAVETVEPLDPLPVDGFHFLYGEKDSKVRKRFADAAKIVADKYKVTTAIDEWSKHFGDWYFIKFKLEEIPRDMIPLDAPARHPDVYLVNLSDGQIIEMGDWRAAKPLFDAILDYYDKIGDDEKKVSLVRGMASAASTVAFRHDRYLEVISGQVFPDGIGDPQLKRTMDGVELVYFISSSGMMRSFTRCQLRMVGKGITFESEIMRPD